MEAFILRATLSTPVSFRSHPHLDALLMAAREKAMGPETVGQPLPLAERDGLWQASQAFAVGAVAHPDQTDLVRPKTVKGPKLGLGDLHWEKSLGNDGRKLHPDSPYRGQLSRYDLLEGVQAVYWQAYGDPEACLGLARLIENVGAMANTGWGRVEQWEILPCDRLAPKDAGWVSEEGMPLRAIPLRLWAPGKELADIRVPDGATVGMFGVRAPYWQRPNQEMAVAPTRAWLTGDARLMLPRIAAA